STKRSSSSLMSTRGAHWLVTTDESSAPSSPNRRPSNRRSKSWPIASWLRGHWPRRMIWFMACLRSQVMGRRGPLPPRCAPPRRCQTRRGPPARTVGARSAAGSGHAAAPPALEVDQEQRDRGRGHARDALGLADGLRPHLLELLPQLGREPAHRGVVEAVVDGGVLAAALALDLGALPLEVAGVLRLDLHLLRHRGVGHAGPEGRYRDQRGIPQAGPTEQVQAAALAADVDAKRSARFAAGGVVRRRP